MARPRSAQHPPVPVQFRELHMAVSKGFPKPGPLWVWSEVVWAKAV